VRFSQSGPLTIVEEKRLGINRGIRIIFEVEREIKG
jgi:hypothetical protein